MINSNADDASSADDVPWLRDMVDDDLKALFVEDEDKLKRAVRHYIQAVQDDSDLEQRLVDLVETALREGNDDTSAAVMTAVILGEARSPLAIPVLLRALASDADEVLQDAAGVALLRIGAPAIQGVMESFDETDLIGSRHLYTLLGQIGVLEDAALNEAVREFLRDRVEAERKKPLAERALEELFHASALLGDHRQLPILQQILAADYRGKNLALLDVAEMLAENAAGTVFVAAPPPWVQRQGWLYQDRREEARVRRSRSGEISIALFDEGDEEDDGEASPATDE